MIGAAIGNLLGPLDYVAVGRILLAALLGGLIGLERERHGRAAGLRTHLLLCVGCALIMQVSLHVPSLFAGHTGGVLRADPGRIAAHSLSGLGFLGAGAIIVLGRRIRGLTTAACIWVAAAMGLAIGCGYVFVAVCTFAVVMFALHVLGRWERLMQAKDRYVRLALTFGEPGRRIEDLRRLLATHNVEVLSYTVDWDSERTRYELQLRHVRRVDFERLSEELRQTLKSEGLCRLKWS
jgi:putative Mg2+ transporter-C (MgtC) family protein